MAEQRPGGWREMRVFISSTFQDMQAERDHLVRFVFPRLREELLRRRVHFVDVDLRWGVTADQDALELCLDEIDRCRPRFICMLGGRYGSIRPPDVVETRLMDALLAGESPVGKVDAEGESALTALYESGDGDEGYRLREKPGEPTELRQWRERARRAVDLLGEAGAEGIERSITHAEILHGALDPERLEEPTYRYFYLRDPPAPDGIPENLLGIYREEPGGFADTALAELKEKIPEAEGKVETAPGRIETVPMPVREYPAEWDPNSKRIVGLRRFGELVYQDILESVDRELGGRPEEEAAEERDAFADENALTEEFVETRIDRYVVGTREPLLDALHEHAEGSGGNGYLCVVGAPGSGKSALLARFYREYTYGAKEPVERENHPDDLVVAHFVGANATNVRELLRRLCHELATGAGVPGELPGDYDGLRDRFPELLGQAAESRRVVILIDAVNQLDPAHGGPDMRWLPDELPDGARVVLTALPSRALDALRGRRESPVEEPLGPLKKDDANAIIDSFLARYRKELDDEQRKLLLAKQDVEEEGSPLYLRTALEELRTLGTYREITDRIEALPGEALDLFHWILVERLEKDEIFRDAEGNLVGHELVRAFCSYLAVGRDGMSEAELVELIAPGDEQNGVEPDPLGNVAALRALLRPYLMRRGGLLDFFHGQLREAVEGSYLDGEEQRLAAHRVVSAYFRRKADPAGDRSWDTYPRGLSELPYHLTEGAGDDEELWQALEDTLTDFRFLERKAMDVGAVEETDAEGNTTTTYTGVFMLQDDFERALAKTDGGDGAGGRRTIIVTGTDLGHGLQIRCPHCNRFSDFQEAWRGKEETCPECGGPWKVNDFVVERPAPQA